MALFGRRCLPHRSSLSRFLADVDRPCLEAFRTLFEQRFAEGWTSETIGGIFDRQGRRYIVFDVDATRQAARQRALPCDPTLPAARRRLRASFRLLSVSRSFSGRCAGWMWQGGRFVASGQPTGGGNMLRYLRCLRLCLRQNLLLVTPEPSVRAIAGVGKTDPLAMPGWDLRKCVSVWPVFPLCSPATNKGGMVNKRSFFQEGASSSE